MSTNSLQAVHGVLYPTVPHWYPNRPVQRAVRHNKTGKLSQVWQQFLLRNPELVQLIKQRKA